MSGAFGAAHFILDNNKKMCYYFFDMKMLFITVLSGIFSLFANASVIMVSNYGESTDIYTANLGMEFRVMSENGDLYVPTNFVPFTTVFKGEGNLNINSTADFIGGEVFSDNLYLILEGKTATIMVNWFVQSDQDTFVSCYAKNFQYHYDSPTAPLTSYGVNGYTGQVPVQKIPEPTTLTFGFIGFLFFWRRRK